MKKEPKVHCDTDLDWSCDKPRVVVAAGGRFLKVSFAASEARAWNQDCFGRRRGPRGVCKGFSFSSRRRLLDKLNCVSKGASLPAFVSLTYPDSQFNDSVTEFAKLAKADLDLWFKRLVRVCPSASGFWRMEWQTRKSGQHEGRLFPHFHLMIWGLPERGRGYAESWFRVAAEKEFYVPVVDKQLRFELVELTKEHCHAAEGEGAAAVARMEWLCREFKASKERPAWVLKVEGREYSGQSSVDMQYLLRDRLVREKEEWMTFQDWASLAWYHVVGAFEVAHFTAGCRVERVRSWGGVMSYCSKYLAKMGEWHFLADVAAGRQWGIFNRAAMPWADLLTIDLTSEVGCRLRRVARRYLERCRGRRLRFGYGVTLYLTEPERLVKLLVPPDTPF